MEVLFAIFWPHHGDNKSARVTHPLWFNADEQTLPQELRDFENYDVIFFPIHHKEMEHWTMGVLHIKKRTIHCDFYNSLPGTTSAAKVKERLKAWIGESGSSRVVSFENKICARQNDGVSCGISVLTNLRRLFRGEPIDLSICLVDARAQLLRDLLEHDASLLPLLSPSHSVLLSEVQALS
ncbi:hypothetical protein EV126DRAFT_175199 [Verticillium dahliae]|nr:hypothetical protein EV126DRAFT_175199 [Verticillium dahliae]